MTMNLWLTYRNTHPKSTTIGVSQWLWSNLDAMQFGQSVRAVWLKNIYLHHDPFSCEYFYMYICLSIAVFSMGHKLLHSFWMYHKMISQRMLCSESKGTHVRTLPSLYLLPWGSQISFHFLSSLCHASATSSWMLSSNRITSH